MNPRCLSGPALFAALGLALAFSGCKSGEPAVTGKAPPAAPSGAADAGAPAAAPALPEPWAGRADLIQAPPAAEPKPIELPPVERSELANGLKVRVVSDHAWPVINLHLVVLGGTDQEPHQLRSLASFAAAMLTKGTASRSADQIAETIDFVGGKLSAWADRDGTHVVCQALSKDLDTCLALLPDVVIRPSFPEKEMGQVRDRLITKVKQVRDMDRALVHEHFDNLLWGEDHIRGWPWTIQSVKAVGRKDLVAWHAARFKPDNAILAVAGDVDPAAIQKRLTAAFADWKPGPVPEPVAYPEPSIQGIRIRLVDKPDQTQTQIMLGHLGIAQADPDLLAVELMNYTLGAGAFSSRLLKVVRSEGGKTYGVRSGFEEERRRGAFSVWTFTRTAETVATLKLVLGEIRRMRDAGPSEQELADAKSNLAGKYPMKFETAEDVAAALLRAELHGLGEDFVREYPVRLAATTREQVVEAAARHLRPDDLVVTLVGNAAEVGPQLAAAGLDYEKIGYLEPTTASERAARLAERQAPADPARTARGRALLDEALAAKGGEAGLRAIRDIWISGQGSMEAKGQKFDVKVTGWYQVPDRRRVEIQIPMGTIVSVIGPDGAWGGFGEMIQDAPAKVAAEQLAALWRHRDLILLRHRLDPDVFVQAREPVEKDGRKYDVVELRKADGSLPTFLWLDPESHLLARIVYEKQGEETFEAYDDYRPVDDLQMAFHQHQQGGGATVDITLTGVKINAGLPAGIFDKPTAAKKGAEKAAADRPADKTP